MSPSDVNVDIPSVAGLSYPLTEVRLVLPVVLLVLFWIWETWQPFFGGREGRWRHAGHNLALALFNTLVLGLLFGTLVVTVAHWTEQNGAGLLNALALPLPLRFLLGLVLLDAWMYLWHRANHAVPFLWRFHRMHHSDNRMDVTTATRFHLGEHMIGAVLRLGLIPVMGWGIWQIVVYELLVIAVTQFHHADIALGRWDRWLRLVVVTPGMHKVHHSRWRPETDSNYSTVLSVWDRLARSFRLRPDPRTIRFGLDEFDDARWQTFWGMMQTPFTDPAGSDGSSQSASRQAVEDPKQDAVPAANVPSQRCRSQAHRRAWACGQRKGRKSLARAYARSPKRCTGSDDNAMERGAQS